MIRVFLILLALLFINSCGSSQSNKRDNIDSNKEYKTILNEYTIKEGATDTILATFQDSAYIEKLGDLDSTKFTIQNKFIALNFIPIYSHPQDIDKDNIYEVKVHTIDNQNKQYIHHIKVKILKASKDNATLSDQDNDFIPDIIEKALNKNSQNSDENNNGILDGLEDDPFFNKQWYIKSNSLPTNPSGVNSIIGNDLNLLNVYKEYMGYNNANPIIIQIVDTGIDIDHEDLKENIDLSRSLNGANQGKPLPDSNYYYGSHGTKVAGVAAARAFNSVGIRGVAPFAKIAGSNWLSYQTLDALEATWFSANGANEIAVSNNSWGKYFCSSTFYEDILKNGTKNLRDGKGRVYIFSSGNDRAYNADANTQYYLNSIYPIVVGAIDYNNKITTYSTPGANLWISAYGGTYSYYKGPTIATTYLSGKSKKTWSEDINKNYTYDMLGTSAAAPMVSGAVALILEACPNLGWRDVKYILAKTAKQIDYNSDWITNSAGLNFSRNYGFGLIDVEKSISMCKNSYNNLNELKTITVNKNINNINIDSKQNFTIIADTNSKIEWVEATIDLNATNASDFDIYLTSPSQTKILLLKHGTKIGASFVPIKNWMKGGFRFSTGAFLDEESIGEWRIDIVNTKQNKATISNIKLTIYGH
jgi:kexin